MWDHYYPCFGRLVMVALGFKVRVDLSLAHFLACTLFPRFTSGVTPADRGQHFPQATCEYNIDKLTEVMESFLSYDTLQRYTAYLYFF